MAGDSKVSYSKCVSEDTRDRFGAEITSLLPLAHLTGAFDNTAINATPVELDCCLNDTAATLHRVLDSVVPLKKPLDTGSMVNPKYTNPKADIKMDGEEVAFIQIR